jgi:hypothetical protein
MKSLIRWLRWKLEKRRLIKELSSAIGDRKLYLIYDEEGEMKHEPR